MVFAFSGAAQAADASSADATANKAPPAAAAPTPTCSSFEDWIVTDCPLSWYGVTIYGTVDTGVGWQSNGSPFNRYSSFGVNYLISKSSNRSLWLPSPNGLSQSNIGVKGNETLGSGWSFIFDLEAAYDPYSLQLANGPRSVAENGGVPLPDQSSGGDSRRGGQFFNNLGYLGFSSPTYGSLTVFRQNTLTLDGIAAYDPMALSYAFSPIGFSGTTCGVGRTEDCGFSTSLKYRVDISRLRFAALWQFGGYDLNNAANGAYQFQLGGDIPNLGQGTLSVDGIYSFVRDAVGTSLAGNPLNAFGSPVPPFLPQVYTATISDNTSAMFLGRYTVGPLKLYAGYEWIQFAPPSDPQTAFNDIGGNFLCIGCADINNTNINNTAFSVHDEILQIFWTGARYSVTDNLDVMGAYYHYNQNSFGAIPCSSAALSTCSGTLDAISFAADWKFAKKFDAYAGLMYSQVNDGLANGYLKHSNIDPTVGIRFKF
jgi:predicted porin